MKLIFLSMMCFFLMLPVFSQGGSSFRQEGIASWYGEAFAGKPTASGELFNPEALTAAHPTLPFGTMVKVTNTHNGKQVIVRINDRGPFVAARIIDLSEHAARQLDMIFTGTAPVIVETVNSPPQSNAVPNKNAETVPAVAVAEAVPEENPEQISENENPEQPQENENSPPISVYPGMPPAGDGKSYRIQVGAYKIEKHASDVFSTLQNAGLTPAYERYNDFYRVVLAQIQSENIQSTVDIIAKAGFAEILIREER